MVTTMLPLFSDPPEQENQDAPERLPSPDFDLHFLALSQVRGLGMNALAALVDHYSDLSLVWKDQPTTISEILHKARIPSSQALAEQIYNSQPALMTQGRQLRDHLGMRNICLVSQAHAFFPQRLKDIPDSPRWLFIEGNPAILNAGSFVAVVGTRKSSTLGNKTAEQVSWLAAQAGLGLVSGLAEGIDAAAHSAAVRNNMPQVAVLGTGIDITFPVSTASLRLQIVETGGCVITEYLPNDNYGKSRFVQRNRIQAGLSEAVCPVEGKAQSGTMHTARFTQKYKRALFGATRGQPVSENEMPSVLVTMDAPVFDIEAANGKKELGAFFDGLPGERFPKPKRPNPEFMFRNVLKAIDGVASYTDLTREEKVYLLVEFKQRLGLDKE